MVIISMTKTTHYNYDDVWKLQIGNIETNSPEVEIKIHEADAEKLKPLFTSCKKSGRFEENEKYV